MSDPRIERLARLLVQYCVEVKAGDSVAIGGGSLAAPLLEETYREVVRAGGHPLVIIQEDVYQEILLKEGSDAQLAHVAEPIKVVTDTFDCRIGIRSTSNTRSLSSIDPKRLQLMQFSRKDLMATSMRRTAEGQFKWVGTLFPTNAFAQEADMSLNEYEDFVYRACFVDKEDPVAEWLKISKMQQKLVDWLQGKNDVRIQGANIDMTLSISERTFINSDGKRNMPSGEIFTGPVEDSAQGWVRFTYPAIIAGREVEGVELKFDKGKVVEAKAAKNEDFLLTVLETDEGARYLGEFAMGTNEGIDRFTKSVLYDEKIGGTIHMALGMGYPQTGSMNESAIHWDMICDMRQGGKIWIDEELFYDSGKFLILE